MLTHVINMEASPVGISAALMVAITCSMSGQDRVFRTKELALYLFSSVPVFGVPSDMCQIPVFKLESRHFRCARETVELSIKAPLPSLQVDSGKR